MNELQGTQKSSITAHICARDSRPPRLLRTDYRLPKARHAHIAGGACESLARPLLSPMLVGFLYAMCRSQILRYFLNFYLKLSIPTSHQEFVHGVRQYRTGYRDRSRPSTTKSENIQHRSALYCLKRKNEPPRDMLLIEHHG